MFAIVEEWLEGLKTDNIDTISSEKRKLLSKASSYMSFALPISTLVGAVLFEPASYGNIFTPIRYLLAVILLVTAMIMIGIKCEDVVSKMLSGITPRTRFNLTAGDQKLNDQIAIDRRKSWRNLTFVFVTLVLAILLSLFVNAISAKLF